MNDLRSICDQLRADAENAYRRGALSTSLFLFERAAELADRLNFKERMGPLLYWIGRCNFALNRLERARQAYIKGREILRELGTARPNADTDYLIYIIGDLGALYLNMGEYRDAKKTALEGLVLSESIAANAHASPPIVARHGMAVAWATLGNVAASEGEYQASLSYLQSSLSLFRQMSLQDSIYKTEIAERLTDIGESHKYAGDHVLALHNFTRALAMAQQEGQKRSVHRVLVSLGILYLDQGDYARATKYLHSSLAIAEELGDISYQINCTANLGFAKLRQGDHQGALRDFEEALTKSQGTQAHHATVPIYEGLAAVNMALRHYEKAHQLFDEALEIVVRLGDKSRQAEIQWWKGEAFHAQGKYEAALGLAEDAYSLSHNLGLRNISRLALTLKGKVHLAQQDYDLASRALSLAIETIEHMRARAAGQEQARALFLEGKLEPYHLMVELLIRQQRESDALLYAERAKSRILLEVMQGGKASVTSVITPEELEKDRKLNAEIVHLNTQIYTEKLRSQSDQARLAALTSTLEKARLEYQAFRDGIYAAHPELRTRSAEPPSLTFDKPSELLSDPKSALLEFVVMDELTYLFIVSSSDRSGQDGDRAQALIKAFPIAVKSSQLKVLVDTFRERLASPHFAAQDAARRLCDLLLGPATAFLADKTNLIVVPDGVLWDLPFQALRKNDNRYLIEDHALSYVPSLNVLWEMIKRNREHTTALRVSNGRAPRLELLAFGNPRLTKQTVDQVAAVHRGEKLLPLPEAEREVKSLKQLYGPRSSVYIGGAALEQHAKGEIGNYRVLHFATHGVLDCTNPMYSNIILSGGDGNEDGLLEAWEIMKLNLSADIAVLSSCETARGRIGAGEGVIGMSWAIFVAGCPTTVVSQWQVDSASTTALMIAFHKNLLLGSKHSSRAERQAAGSRNRMSKAEALRQSMLTVMKDRRFKNPYYWAGFVVVGDGR